MRSLSNTLLSELYGQDSSDPFLTLLTISHTSITTIYMVNNSTQVISNGNTFEPFPFFPTLPNDDGETVREVTLTIENISLALIDELRTVTDPLEVKLEMVLASNPDYVEIEIGELKLKDVRYNVNTIQGRLILDDFLNTEMTGEKYTPTNFPGLFQ